jgi:transposase InsO family protein
MGQHGSARLSVHSRLTIARRVIEEGWTVVAAARAADVSRQTASKWVGRFLAEGPDGLRDRSTRPHTIPRRVAEALVAKIVELRLLRMGPHRIGWTLEVARSTVYAVLRRLGLSHLRTLEPRPEVRRYEWAAPGDLVHLDTKKLGRIAGVGKRFGSPSRRNRGIGWNHAHVAIDDHSRLAYAEELPDEHPATTVAFVQRALAFYGAHGIKVHRILTDNGGCYRSRMFRNKLAAWGIAERKTRPYHPQTNGKAEAMVKILINSWAYARPYESSAERASALSSFMAFYNHDRPHGGLNGARPIDRVRQ